MKFKSYILLLGCLLGLSPLIAQVPDSIRSQVSPPEIPLDTPSFADSLSLDSSSVVVDSVKKKQRLAFIRDIFSKEDYPNPKKALYLSMAIPGAGQIYNKRWWKLPFVYGSYTLLVLAVQRNTSRYKLFRDAYIAELAGEEHSLSFSNLDAADFRRIRDGYDKNRQLSYIGIFAVHLIQTAEAFVDCHLKTFDVSDDLSMRIQPDIGIAENGQSYVGLGLRFQIGR